MGNIYTFLTPKFWWILDFITNSMNLVILFIFIQVGFLILMLIYVVYLRIINKTRKKWLDEKHQIWYDIVFAYLEDEISTRDIKTTLNKNEYRQFGEFIKGFLLDIAGEDKQKISNLMREIEYPKYLLEKLNDKDVQERSFALYFMGLMDCTHYVKEIRAELDDPYEYNKFLAASVLMQIKDLKSIRLIFKKFNAETYSEYAIRLTTLISYFGVEMLPEVLDVFNRLPLANWLKLVCLRLFRMYTYYEAQTDILRFYDDTENVELKYECLKVLKIFENPDLVRFFEKQLEVPNFTIKQISASALGMMTESSSLNKLEKLLYINNFWVLKRVIEAIFQFKEPGLKILKSHAKYTQNELCKKLITEVLQ